MAHIVLVDDHEIVIDSLKYLIENQSNHEVVGKFNQAESALQYIKENRLKIEVVVSDIKLPSMSGIDLTKKIKEFAPQIKVILLSQFSTKEFVVNGIKNGANGYLLKSTGGVELVASINAVLSGKRYLCAESTQVLICATSEDSETLSEREMEVLKYIAMGFNNNEVADKLCVSSSTVEFHKRNIRSKLNAHKVTDLTRIALIMGLID
ncbi:MAG: response regulator [Bacteroidia bacterium]